MDSFKYLAVTHSSSPTSSSSPVSDSPVYHLAPCYLTDARPWDGVDVVRLAVELVAQVRVHHLLLGIGQVLGIIACIVKIANLTVIMAPPAS